MNGLNKDRLAYWVTYPDEIEMTEVSQLEEITAKYPYFQLAYLLLVKAKARFETADIAEAVSKASAYALNRNVLRRIVENDLNWNVPPSRTDDHEQAAVREAGPVITEAVETVPENPGVIQEENVQETVTKTEEEMQEEELAAKKMHRQIIEKFIKNDPKIRPVNDFLSEQAEHSDLSLQALQPLNSGSLATESFAIILEKQGKFSKSKEIYEKLILKNPEKKDYFAEKIKELSDRLNN